MYVYIDIYINRQLNKFTKYDVSLQRGIAMVSYCVNLTSVYSITVGKFVLTSVSGSCLKGCLLCMWQFHISHLNIKGSAYCLDCKDGIF